MYKARVFCSKKKQKQESRFSYFIYIYTYIYIHTHIYTYIYIYIFFFWLHLQHVEIPGSGIKLSHCSDQNHSSDNAKSLTTRPPGNSQILFLNNKFTVLFSNIIVEIISTFVQQQMFIFSKRNRKDQKMKLWGVRMRWRR